MNDPRDPRESHNPFKANGIGTLFSLDYALVRLSIPLYPPNLIENVQAKVFEAFNILLEALQKSSDSLPQQIREEWAKAIDEQLTQVLQSLAKSEDRRELGFSFGRLTTRPITLDLPLEVLAGVPELTTYGITQSADLLYVQSRLQAKEKLPPADVPPAPRLEHADETLLEKLAEEATQVTAISLNWLMSGTEFKDIPTGGPGGLRKPLGNLGSTPLFTLYDAHKTGENPAIVPIEPATTAVHVIILDTVSEQGSAQPDSSKAAGKNTPASSAHPDVVVDTVGAMPSEIDNCDSGEIEPHGDFIEDIIKTIAGEKLVTVHRIQLLNQSGIGSLKSFNWAFKELVKKQNEIRKAEPTAPILVNFSSGLSFSPDFLLYLMRLEVERTPGEDQKYFNWLSQQNWVPDRLQNNIKTRKDSSAGDSLIEILIDFAQDFANYMASSLDVTELNTYPDYFTVPDLNVGIPAHPEKMIMFAAAGNDSYRLTLALSGRFNACYPAQLQTVIGVGALDKSGHEATYSNWADDPKCVGYWIFGGGIDAVAKEISGQGSGCFRYQSTGGVVARYAPGNWGEWSGTSFATAVFTGFFAALAAGGDPHPLKTLHSYCVPGTQRLIVEQA